jgi:hypothetical protein
MRAGGTERSSRRGRKKEYERQGKIISTYTRQGKSKKVTEI